MTNTSPSKYRNWCFTCNNYTDDDIDNVKALDSKYLIIGKEVGDSGTPHLQGYIEFTSQVSFKSLSKRLPRFHLEDRKGTSQQAASYCQKGGNYEEFGTISQQGKRNDIKTIVAAVAEGKSFEDLLDIGTSYQSLQIAKVVLPYKEPKRDWVPTVKWYWGPPGCSKTHTAFHEFPNERIHIQAGKTKWWEGYDRHPVVILDDLRQEHIDFVRLLQLLDRYPCTVENKGGSRQFVPKHIIITSPYHPKFQYSGNGENIEQLLRRIHVIQEFDTKYVGPVQIDDAPQDSSA